MAVFCSTPINYSQIDDIKGYNDTVGIVGINDSTPTVIYWKNKPENENGNVNDSSYKHFFQITHVAAAGSVADDGSTAAKHNILDITNNDDYLQVQDNSKCAIHALNNLLKGEYFTTVDITNDEKGIIEFPPDDEDLIQNVKQKLDLLKQKYYETNGKAGVNLFAVGTLLKKYAPLYFGEICKTNSGDSYATAIINIALNMFGYHADTINPADKQNDYIFNALKPAKDNFVGMILNTSLDDTGRGGHFIAIRRVTVTGTNGFILVDSFNKDSAQAVISGVIPLDNAADTNNFISNWLNKNTMYPFISNPGYVVTNNNPAATEQFNNLIITASGISIGGRKSSTKKRSGRSTSIAHSSNLAVRQRYTTKRRKSPYILRSVSKPRRKSSTRKRR